LNEIGGEYQRRHDGRSDVEADLAVMSKSIFIIGNKPVAEIKPGNARPFWVRYKSDGLIHNRAYRSGVVWRTRVIFSLRDGLPLEVLEMDEWGRLKALFSKEIVVRLAWNAAQNRDHPPVARLFDPDGPAEMLLLRGRCAGHAVDVLHNLTRGGRVLQPLWIADIMRLNPLLGIKLVRDEIFTGGSSISEPTKRDQPR
jgi:hypothetical protein